MRKIALTSIVALVSIAISSAAFGQCGSVQKDAAVKAASDHAGKAEKMDIIETAVAAGGFETLATAIKAAGLVDALKGEGPFTVFAPTDSAFAALPEGALESLLKDKEALTAVLTYHVVPGSFKARDVIKASKLSSLNGKEIPIKMYDNKVLVAGAEVKSTDIVCSNGLIHVIDRVILPEMGE